LRTSNGTVLGTFAVGSFPSGMAFDGVYVWVANSSSATLSIL
jgi:DNA-binding beta-propeller fold protein YncE